MATSNLFFYCFCGKVTTESFLGFGDATYESNWYNLPNNLQLAIFIMIANAQKPLSYHGCGIFNLDLQLFTTVRSTHFMYNYRL